MVARIALMKVNECYLLFHALVKRLTNSLQSRSDPVYNKVAFCSWVSDLRKMECFDWMQEKTECFLTIHQREKYITTIKDSKETETKKKQLL